MSSSKNTCPHCNTIGTVIRHNHEIVSLECPKCKQIWKTWSEICPDCHHPNGFAIEGPCSECYVERYKSS
jgi:hypothetical protein